MPVSLETVYRPDSLRKREDDDDNMSQGLFLEESGNDIRDRSVNKITADQECCPDRGSSASRKR